MEKLSIGTITHEYGGLKVKKEYGLYFWSIEANTFSKWEEIPKSLYDELIKFNESLKK